MGKGHTVLYGFIRPYIYVLYLYYMAKFRLITASPIHFDLERCRAHRVHTCMHACHSLAFFSVAEHSGTRDSD